MSDTKADLSCLKFERLALADQRLAEYLSTHPVEVNGKLYGVTEREYSDLLSFHAARQFMAAAGHSIQPEWHTLDGACQTCTEEELTQISVAIISTVYPRKKKLQEIRSRISAATSEQEVNAVEISFE